MSKVVCMSEVLIDEFCCVDRDYLGSHPILTISGMQQSKADLQSVPINANPMWVCLSTPVDVMMCRDDLS